MTQRKKVAVVGCSFRFPGSDAASFWPDLLNGRDFVNQVDATRWPQDEFLHPDKANPATSYTFSSASLGDVSGFDASFFNISPREAAMMDPQQRLLLEMCWETFENAGVPPSSLRGSDCGVFLGIASVEQAYRLVDDMASIDAATATGNTMSIAANRLSFFYDLRGPSMAIDTACSSSLVAFHQACQAIASGEVSQAITGGISLHLHPFGFMIFSKASMLSRTGRCQAFDGNGDGYARSEGGGLFLLKDYDQAVADGNPILAVVAASGVNTDGRKSSLTLPSSEAQAALLRQVYAKAGISPTQLDYLEAHGTGTAVGDPIETRAIGQALGQAREASQPLPIGSIKSNLGHLEAASGVAGLMKVLNILKARAVPATIKVQALNPEIPFTDYNLQVVTDTLALKDHGPLTVGINSFGFGGANAHVILQSPPEQASPAHEAGRAVPLMVSGKDRTALQANAARLADCLSDAQAPTLYDAAYQSLFRREQHLERLVVLGAERREVAQALADFAQDPSLTALSSLVEQGQGLDRVQGPVFVYSGNGSQWAGMGAALLEHPVFAAAVDEVDGVFQPLAGYSLRAELAGLNGSDRYAATEIAQPALFALQVGITRVLAEQGVHPHAVLGHSVGEVAAAWACGALSLVDATGVIYHRSRLQGLTRGSGRMAAVGLGGAQAQVLLAELNLADDLVVAGENSARGATLAGSLPALERLEAVLSERQVFYRLLDLDYAFHSAAMDPIQVQVIADLAHIVPNDTRIPFFSTVTGEVLAGQALDSHYWWQNIRRPVLFEGAMQGLIAQGFNLFVEVGPHPILRSYVTDGLTAAEQSGRLIPTLQRKDAGPDALARTFAQLLIAGLTPDWQHHFPVAGRPVGLPTYAWQHEHFHLPVSPESSGQLHRWRVHPLLGYRLPDREPTWENRLDTRLFPTLADHKVGDAVLFPGAGFTELALAAAQLHQPGEFVDIEELEIHSPLILADEGSKKVQVRIEESDGTLHIRSRGVAQSEEWVEHVVARLPGEARGALLDARAPALPARQPDHDAQQHLAMTCAVGLNYGPAYQAVQAVWVEGTEVLARLAVPEAISAELAGLHLHPALLDGAFQLITALLVRQPSRNRGLAFIPVKLGRIAFAREGGVPCLAQVCQVKRSDHSLLVDFTLYDDTGRAVLFIKDARFRGVRLQRDSAEAVRHLATVGLAAPLAGQPVTREAFEARASFVALAQLADEPLTQRYLNEVDPLLDVLCGSFMVDLVQQCGAVDAARIDAWAAHVPRAFIETLLAQGEADGSLVRDSDGRWQALDDADRPASEVIWRELFQSYPEYFQLIHSVGRIGRHLGDLLEGRQSLVQLMPRETSGAGLVRQVLGSAGQQRVLAGVQDSLARQLAQLPAGQRLRVLELDLGGEALVRELYSRLDLDRIDYCYCAQDAEQGELLRAEFPALVCVTAEALAHTAAFDLVLVPSDLAALQQIGQSLTQAATRLLPGGHLVLLAQHPTRWVDFLLGADAAWWLSTPEQALSRQQRPLFWEQELERLGLRLSPRIECLPGSACGSYLLLAQAPAAEAAVAAVAAPQHWALMAARDDAQAVRLAAALSGAGQQVQWLAPGDRAALAAQLQALPARPDQLLHLAGFASVSGLSGQAERCLDAAGLVQAAEQAGLAAPVWLLTRGAAAHLCGEAPSASLAVQADAALWGFGRTLANEFAASAVRLLDLAQDGEVESLLPVLLQADDEREMAVDAAGCRFVPRLRVMPVEATARADEAFVTLGFDLPGQLRNLRWEARDAVMPAADELDVEVHATGLNFRDVMYALGLLSDEAIENGFSGPTLGFEFAGVVRGQGAAAVGGFAVGDRVVGFGPKSFANRLVTNANAVARIPQGMSFEAAATIPSTFFTVFYALSYLARLEPGEKVLIHGAAGGVGIAAIQIARWCGADIYATAGSDEKRDFLRLLGVQHIYDSRSLAYADQVLADTAGRGVDVVLNSLAGEAINRNLRVLKPFGRFLELGKRDFYQNTRIGLRPFRNNISYFGIDADQLMSERPELTRRLFADMMALFEQGVLHPLPFREFDANQVVEAFRYMQQARQIGKIVVTYRNGIDQVVETRDTGTPTLSLDPQACYLVTGGLGGFGLRTAQWLVDKGARHLVLLGRRGAASEEAQPALAAWQAQGVDAQAVACDVTDRDQLSAVFARIAQGPWPLRGVVHAATVIDDGLVRNIDAAQLTRVLEPKALGAQYLHELTCELPLDFFVLYSSATTLFGNPGQANYVAANHWLEALARHRRAQGLAATAVLWGAIDDAGFLARNSQIKDALQSRMGGAALRAELALAHLERLLLSGDSGLGVLELEWKALARFLPSAVTPRFAELARAFGKDQEDDSDAEDIQRLLAELTDEQLLERFGEMLRHEVSEILRLPASRLDGQRPLQELGLDSLMSVELVVALEERFGIRLPVMELSENSSIDKLARRLLDLLRGDRAEQDETEALASNVMARHGEQLSAEELAALGDNLHAAAPGRLIE